MSALKQNEGSAAERGRKNRRPRDRTSLQQEVHVMLSKEGASTKGIVNKIYASASPKGVLEDPFAGDAEK